jgi:hypothetical protein
MAGPFAFDIMFIRLCTEVAIVMCEVHLRDIRVELEQFEDTLKRTSALPPSMRPVVALDLAIREVVRNLSRVQKSQVVALGIENGINLSQSMSSLNGLHDGFVVATLYHCYNASGAS